MFKNKRIKADNISRLTEEEATKKINDLIILYLQGNPPVFRHKLIMSWNFDNENDVLNWVAAQPDTDKATALAMYWMLAPRWLKQYKNRDDLLEKESWLAENYDLVKTIEQNYLSGFYANQAIAFDPACDWYETDWTDEYSDIEVAEEIPAILYQPLQGEKVDMPEDWDEGIPAELQEQVSEIIDAIEE